MKILKIVGVFLISISVFSACSKNIDENKNTETLEQNKEDTSNPDNINNIAVDEKKVKNEVEKIEDVSNRENRKVKLNIETKVQEVWNYCAPTTVSMMLSSQGIDVNQHILAREMGTYEPFGTHNKDAVRILNKHMFGYEDPKDNQAGYRIEVVKNASSEEVELFKKRLKKDIDDGYPVYLTMDVSKIYQGLSGEHNVAAIGYIEDSNGNIVQVYYQDPAPKVQDKVYKGLKIETPEKILESMLTCEEPNYAW